MQGKDEGKEDKKEEKREEEEEEGRGGDTASDGKYCNKDSPNPPYSPLLISGGW